MIKPLLLGGSVALVLGAVAGGFAQASVDAVVSSGPSRLEIASYAAPVQPTPWAEGDVTAPQSLPVSTPVWTATPQGPTYQAVAWSTPTASETPAPPVKDTPELANNAQTPALAPVEQTPAETPDPFALEPAAEGIAPPTEPDPDLIVAGLAS